MKVAILGSNGTIGSVIKNELSSCETIGITRDICDLRDYDKLKLIFDEHRFDAVVNCATVGGKLKLNGINYNEFYSNLTVFNNLKRLSSSYGVLINIGSGAEYNATEYTNLDHVKESDLTELPKATYGLSKHLISKFCLDMKNAITLRIFGCFTPNEPPFRVLRKFVDYSKENRRFTSKTRKFSVISAIDLGAIVDQAISTWKFIPKDINCAYKNPTKLNEFLQLWCDIHNKKIEFDIEETLSNYTCNTDLMYFNFSLKYGLEKSLEKYE